MCTTSSLSGLCTAGNSEPSTRAEESNLSLLVTLVTSANIHATLCSKCPPRGDYRFFAQKVSQGT
jgi:hypothetical protein